MAATSSTISRFFVAIVLIFSTLFVTACSRKKDKPTVTGIDATVDANNSDIVVSGGPVVADGAATAAVAITLKDIKGDAVAGVTPAFAVSPVTGATASACSVSDAHGVSSCTLTSILAETKTVAIAYPIQKAGNTVDFTAGAANKICFRTQPGNGTAGVAWAQQPVVFVGDANCNLVNTATNNITASMSSGTMGSLAGTTTLAATAGVATFTDLSLTVAGSKSLVMTGASIAGTGTSAVFAIAGNAPASMVFSTQPSGGSAGIAWPTQPVVRLNDTYGNIASAATNTVTLFNLGTGALGGGFSRNAVNGIASFAGLNIDAVGTKSLRAVATIGGGTVTVDSSSFPITAGVPVKLAFSTQPGNGTISIALGQQPEVQIQDAGGNVVTTAANAVTMELMTGSGTLAGTVVRTASAGVATYSGLSINATGNKVLRATASGLASAISGTISISAAAPVQLCYQNAPGPLETAGISFVVQPVVFIGDSGCNLVTTASGTIAMSVIGGGSLLGQGTLTTTGGVAEFTDLALTLAGTKQLRATYSGPSMAGTQKTTGTFSVVAGSSVALFFSTQPGSGTAGIDLPQQPVVQIRDAFGNVTSANEPVAINLTNGSMGVLTGAGTSYSSNGVLSFSNLSVNTPGLKTLTVTSGTLTSATSNNFTILVGAAAQLAFLTEPAGGTASVAFPTQPRVVVQDSQGNPVNSSASVSLSLGAGATGVLSGATTLAATNGTASFSGLSIDQIGPKTLVAQASGLTWATTGTFNISPGPFTRLCYVQQPGTTVAGVALAPQPVVQLSDSACNPTGGTNAVSLAVQSGTGTLSGAVSLSASGGTVSFSGLSMQVAGTKVLRATSGTITADTSAFTILPSSPTNLIFSTQPGNGVSGVALATQPIVQVRDGFGNIATNSSLAVAINLSNGTMGVLTGAGTLTASGGTLSYSGLAVNLAGTKTLTITSGTLTQAVSNSFIINAGSAAKLAFVTEPGGGTATMAWLQQPRVAVQDVAGNFVTSSANISLSILAPGTGALSGTTSIVASSGTASFAGLSIDVSETGKQLVASSPGLTNGTSATFNILTGPFSRLCLQAQPGVSTAGFAFATQPEYRLGDAACNQVMSASNTVALSVLSGTGSLFGSSSIAATAGYAAFSGISMQTAGTKVIRATSGTVTIDTSAFVVNAAPASKLVFTTQPSNGTSMIALATQPVVQFQDPYNNLVSSSAVVGLAVSSGTISGSASVAASGGVATYSGLSFNTVGAKTLTATSGTLSGTSGTFNISHGAANRLVFQTEPGGGTAGTAWAQQPVVLVQDSAGNTVTTGSVSVALAVTTGTGTMGGTTTRFSSSGIATYSGLLMTAAGTNKVLTASSSGLTSAVSTPAFTIVPAAPSATLSTFSASPTTLFAAGTLSSSTLSGVILDAYSNPVPSKTVYVSSSRGATDNFVGTVAVSNASGQVSYSVSSTTAGIGTMSISIPADGVTISQRPVLTFQSWVATLANSSWSIAPVTIAANGVATANINVILRNASGVALPNKAVTVASSRGATDTITTSPGITNGSGQATFTIRSSTRGEPTLTMASSGDSLNLTTSGKVLFYDVAPVADWQAQLAVSSANSMGPGTSGVSVWKDLFNLGPNDGTVYNLGAIATSGWCGNGTGTVGTCTTGPYRLSLDGTDDYVNFGTGLNSYASRTHEMWVRSTIPTDKGELLLSNGDASNRGLSLRQAWDGTGRVELTAGRSLSYPGEVWQDAPIAYWRMNEISGTLGAAIVGATLQYTNMGTMGTASGIQDDGYSAFFNGTSSYGNVGNLYPPTANMTISAMINPTSVSGTDTIVSKGSSTTQGYSLELVSGRLTFRSRSSAGNQVATGATTLAINTWYHVAGVRDTSTNTIRVYVNGVQDGSTAISGTVSSSTNNFNVGRLQTGANYFAGRIDEVAIYSTALSVTRLAAQSAASNQHTCYSTAALPAGSWKQVAATFDDATKNMSLYVNGVLQCTRASTGYSNGASTYPLAIGAEVNAGGTPSLPYFQGMYGDVRVYDSALTATQLLNNYNATSARFP